MVPDIATSTREEREAYILHTFRCRADCDNCGLCQIYHGQAPEKIYADYIEGKRSFGEIAQEYR